MAEKSFLQLQPQQVIEGPLLRNGIVLYPRPEYTTGLLSDARNIPLLRNATCRPTRWGTHYAGVRLLACQYFQSVERARLVTHAKEARERGRLSDSVPLVVRSGECAYGNLKYDIRLRTHGRRDAARRSGGRRRRGRLRLDRWAQISQGAGSFTGRHTSYPFDLFNYQLAVIPSQKTCPDPYAHTSQKCKS